jgi:NADPH:quinone reductase-like Zn-dependent oxidoreductase
MRALLCHRWGEVEELAIEGMPVPTPAAGDVLIAVKAPVDSR